MSLQKCAACAENPTDSEIKDFFKILIEIDSITSNLRVLTDNATKEIY